MEIYIILSSLTIIAAIVWGFVQRNKKNAIEKEKAVYASKLAKSEEDLKAANSLIIVLKESNHAVKSNEERLSHELEATGLALEEAKSILAIPKSAVDIEVLFCEDETGDSAAAEKRLPFFEFIVDRRGEFRWRFKANNHKIVADSGESYKTKQSLKKGVSVLINSITSGEFSKKWKKE
jgi:uncharacterized protein YegP (UPF0339 family)